MSFWKTSSGRRTSLFLGGLILVQLRCGPKMDLDPAPPFAYAFVANTGSHTLSVIDLKSFKNIKTIPVGKSPTKLAASPKGHLLLVANTGSNSVSAIDSVTHKVLKTISTGKSPLDINFSSDGQVRLRLLLRVRIRLP